ncbi:MAG: molybdopterin-binding protein [Thermodesulfovibrionales bacterium]|nr:molybdopterin-binding protein [Thermodesulfovibrionales bacterium]
MCDIQGSDTKNSQPKAEGVKTIPVTEAVGTVLAHDITEIKKDEFKGRAFKKGHLIKEEDITHLQRLGKENLFVLNIADDEMHEDEAAYALADALMGEGVKMEGDPKEGKINIIADRDGLLKINKDILTQFNMLGDVMCATLHSNTPVKKGQLVGGTRAIPLVVKKSVVEEAVAIANSVKASEHQSIKDSDPLTLCHSDTSCSGVIEVKELRKLCVGIVITGNEVYYGRIKDAFAPVITKKLQEYGCEIVGIYFAPDDEELIETRLRELVDAGAELLITTGGMSVDPDDVTRFAIRRLGVTDIVYGSAALPGAMFLVAYLQNKSGVSLLRRPAEAGSQESGVRMQNSELRIPNSEPIPILGIPACGMYHKITIFDLILPRALAGEIIGRKELAELGHGGLCLNCKTCSYPVCPFGK